MVHVGGGAFITDEEHVHLLELFTNGWNKNLQYGKKGQNTKDEGSKKHRDAYDALISTIWPAGTQKKFLKLPGDPNFFRPAFHTQRQSVCERKMNDC